MTTSNEKDDTCFSIKFNLGSEGVETILTITPNGDIVVNPKWSMTEAAKAFWDAVRATAHPNSVTQKHIADGR